MLMSSHSRSSRSVKRGAPERLEGIFVLPFLLDNFSYIVLTDLSPSKKQKVDVPFKASISSSSNSQRHSGTAKRNVSLAESQPTRSAKRETNTTLPNASSSSSTSRRTHKPIEKSASPTESRPTRMIFDGVEIPRQRLLRSQQQASQLLTPAPSHAASSFHHDTSPAREMPFDDDYESWEKGMSPEDLDDMGKAFPNILS